MTNDKIKDTLYKTENKTTKAKADYRSRKKIGTFKLEGVKQEKQQKKETKNKHKSDRELV